MQYAGSKAQEVHVDGECPTNVTCCYYHTKQMLQTLRVWLAGLGFGSEFPGSQWEAANRVSFTVSSVYKGTHDAKPDRLQPLLVLKPEKNIL